MDSRVRGLNRADVSVDDIKAQILAHHGGDMKMAHKEMYFISRYDRTRQKADFVFPVVGLGMTAISGFNVARMGVLSKTGKIGAIAGLITGPLMMARALPSSGASAAEDAPAE